MATELNVHPAVQRANDVLGMAFAVQHQRLPMPTTLLISFRDGGVAHAWKVHGRLNQRFPYFLNRRFCPNPDFLQGEFWSTVPFGW